MTQTGETRQGGMAVGSRSREEPGVIECARRVPENSVLVDDRRDRLAGIVNVFDACCDARRRAEAWLAASEERTPSGPATGTTINDARALAADSAFLAMLKARLELAINRHKRLMRGANAERRRRPGAASWTKPTCGW